MIVNKAKSADEVEEQQRILYKSGKWESEKATTMMMREPITPLEQTALRIYKSKKYRVT